MRTCKRTKWEESYVFIRSVDPSPEDRRRSPSQGARQRRSQLAKLRRALLNKLATAAAHGATAEDFIASPWSMQLSLISSIILRPRKRPADLEQRLRYQNALANLAVNDLYKSHENRLYLSQSACSYQFDDRVSASPPGAQLRGSLPIFVRRQWLAMYSWPDRRRYERKPARNQPVVLNNIQRAFTENGVYKAVGHYEF